jgi:hypothetical protein
MKLTLLIPILSVALLASCASMMDDSDEIKVEKYTPFSDAPAGISIVSASTSKYATWGPDVEPCTYHKFYISTVGDKAVAILDYTFSVWVPKGKNCKRKVEEFVTIAPRCNTPNFPGGFIYTNGQRSSPYRFYRTIITTRDTKGYIRDRYPADISFEHHDGCHVAFIDN